jgi:hypothetical protein
LESKAPCELVGRREYTV